MVNLKALPTKLMSIWRKRTGSPRSSVGTFCSADPDVPTLLRGDPVRLRQILTNLVGNAVKFTNAGEVAISVSLKDEGDEGVKRDDKESALLQFSVRDTGIGIPADKVCLLFNKFSQVDPSITRQYDGAGLGLAISPNNWRR